MMRNVRDAWILFIKVLLLVGYVQSEGCSVVLRDNGPVVSGANITIWATVYNEEHEKASGSFVYTWEDDTLPNHFYTEESTNPVSYWNVSYPSPEYYPSTYLVEVKVEFWPSGFHFWEKDLCRTGRTINITDLLNGQLDLHQNSTTAENNQYVSSKQPVVHKVNLKQPDSDFLRQNATEITTYWFIDCHYYGATSDYTFNYTFKDVGKDHSIAALVIASYEQPTPTTTTTTTTTPVPPSNSTGTTTAAPPSNSTGTTAAANSTTPRTTPTAHATTVSPNTTVSKATANTTSTKSVLSTTPMTPAANATNSTTNSTGPFPLPAFLPREVCLNFSVVPRDSNKTYGYFQKQVSVRAPVENLAYIGTNWIQPGDILDLQVYCNGSGTFQYCAYPETQDYNVTGHETCLNPITIENCSFPVKHLPKRNMSMVIVISNVVSKEVLGVKINMYSAQKNAQLSVIVVPVSCSIVAAVFIVFGAAYYVQKRARFTVEIADFDFGQSDDLEYKTFRKRLMDAVNNAVNRVEVLDEENTATGSGNKYGTLE